MGALALVGCGAGEASRAMSSSLRAPETVTVTERNFTIILSTGAVAAGKVIFRIRNAGEFAHELLVFRTSLPASSLPKEGDGRVNETAVPKVLDTNTDLPPGSRRQLSVDLPAGRYVVVCNLSNHYLAGMRTTLVVK
jgi:uncharacterized cupredoxin-like copper-binding protein